MYLQLEVSQLKQKCSWRKGQINSSLLQSLELGPKDDFMGKTFQLREVLADATLSWGDVLPLEGLSFHLEMPSSKLGVWEAAERISPWNRRFYKITSNIPSDLDFQDSVRNQGSRISWASIPRLSVGQIFLFSTYLSLCS